MIGEDMIEIGYFLTSSCIYMQQQQREGTRSNGSDHHLFAMNTTTKTIKVMINVDDHNGDFDLQSPLSSQSRILLQLHSSINQSRSGDDGGDCIAHRECKPGWCCCWYKLLIKIHAGHCCHRSSRISSIDQESRRRSTDAEEHRAVCVLHGLINSVDCIDSCQCSAGLHCFRNAVDSFSSKVHLIAIHRTSSMIVDSEMQNSINT